MTTTQAPSRTARSVSAEEHPHPDRWRILLVLCTSVVMIVVAVSSMNVALPSIQRSLNSTGGDLQWVVDSYALAFAGLLLPAGALGDRFGRRGALQVGLLVFGAAALAAAYAGDVGTLIAARAAMGIGAAFIMPSTLSIVMGVFPAVERPKAIAVWATFAGAGGALGPIVSGVLLEHFWWGSVLLVDVPLATALLVLSMRLVPTSRSADGHALDLIGAVLSFVALTALVYGVIEGPHQGWTHSTTVIAFAVAAASAVLLLRFELRTPAPMLDPRLFRDPSLVGGTAAITSVFFAIFGMFFLVTQHLQYVRGHTPLEAGLRITPNALAVLIMSSQVPRLTTRFGSRRVMSAGFIAAAVGFVILATLNPSTSDWIVAAGLLGTGTGMALVMPGGSQHIMASVPAGKAGVGSALNDASREVGGALGIAVAGSIAMTAFRNSHAATAVARITRGAAPGSIGEALQRINHAAESGTINATARTALVSDVRMAFAHGTSIAFTTIAALTAIAGLLAIRQLPKRSTPTTPNQQTSAGPETHQQEDINMQPAAIRHGDGDTYDVLGSTMTIKADADATGGAVEIAVVDTRHGADVPPHTHPWAETYLILDGELDVQIGPTRHHATKGDFLTVPAGTVHGFSVISDRASFLHVSIGSGAVDLFRDLDAAVPHIPSPDDVPTIVEIGSRHGARLAPAP